MGWLKNRFIENQMFSTERREMQGSGIFILCLAFFID
jgi:hypothetical protein